MNGFNPFDFLKEKGLFGAFHSLDNLQQMPWLEKYLNNLLGPDFWSQVMGNRQHGLNKTEVFQTTDEVIVTAEIPGLENERDVRIHLKGLTLFLEATIPADSIKAGRKITRKVNLPFPVNSFGARALYKNGILEIRLPKEPHIDESHIEVKFL